MNRTGTREWSSHSVNIQTGCKHDCRYCYAREMAVRFGRCSREEWSSPVIDGSQAFKPRRLHDGVIMFPTTHDITLANLGDCMLTLEHLLDAGNEVLVVSKPHTLTMSALMPVARRHGDRVEVRCTITAGGTTEEVKRTSYWEPFAPPAYERLWALKMAFDWGLRTSVSIEPALMLERVPDLAATLEEFVTETIWIGLMNQVRRRVRVETAEDEARVAEIEAEQTPEKVRQVYEQLKHNPKVRWKDSIRKTLGLKEQQLGHGIQVRSEEKT